MRRLEFSAVSSSRKLPRRLNQRAAKKLEPDYQVQLRVFMATEKWMVRSTGVGGLIFPQKRNLWC